MYKRLSPFFLFVGLLSFFLVSCGNKDTISLQYTTAEGEIEAYSNLQFVFDKDIVPDSLIGYWVNTPYVSFTPPVDGEFRWERTNELVFSPAHGFAPATRYTASITKEVLAHTEGLSLDVDDLSFATAGLTIPYAAAYWLAKDKSARLDLNFSYAVRTEDVIKAITVKEDGRKLTVNSTNDRLSKTQTLDLEGLDMEDKDYELEITLDKSLAPEGAQQGMAEDLSLSVSLVSPFRLDVLDVRSEHDGSQAEVVFDLSQEVDVQNLASYLTVSPDVDYDIKKAEGGFRLVSEKMTVDGAYTITLAKGLPGLAGGTLRSDVKRDITFGALEPEVSFVSSDGYYLSAKGNRNLEINIINVPEVEIVISKIYKNNLIAEDDYGYDVNNSADDYKYYFDEGYSWRTYQTGDVIYRETIETNTLPKKGLSSLLSFSIKDKLKEYDGVYHIEVRSTEDYWERSSRMVSVSDIGLIAKKGLNYVDVYANSIATADALMGVEISVLGRNNQVVGTGVTASDGHARIPITNKDIIGFNPTLVCAENNGDFNVLSLHENEVEYARYDIGGRRYNASGLDLYLYPERDLYRPGETAHLAGIVRNESWGSPGRLPIRVEVSLPDGKSLYTYNKNINDEGSFEVDFPLMEGSITGSYGVKVYTGDDVLLGATYISVEEFMPDRIKVKTELSNNEVALGEEVSLDLTATNLFGPPASDRTYEVDFSVSRSYFSSEDFPDYSFGLDDVASYFDNAVREGETDDRGQATESFSIPESWENRGKLEGEFITTVFDETGRPVSQTDRVSIYTQDVFFGIGRHDYYVGTGRPVNVPMVAVDKDGKATKATANVRLYRIEYRNVLNRSGSYYRYRSQRVPVLVSEDEVSFSGKANYQFTPETSGRYVVEVYHPESGRSHVESWFYAYSYGRTSATSFEVDREGEISIQANKEEYETGDRAKLLFTTPFDGRMLVTVEQDDVLTHRFLTVEDGAAEMSLSLTEEHLPNVYIGATLFKKHEETSMPLTVAYGYQSLTVNQPSRNIEMEIDAVAKSRSKTQQTIRVKAEPNAMVTIAVVDEGILQITGFASPDPYDYFYAKRALPIRSYNVYPYLYPEVSSSGSAGGGGMMAAMDGRSNPITAKRVNLVSYWSGLVKANSRGVAELTIDIPQFSGSLRVMAASHKDKAFGSAQKNIQVADPIVISSGIPRFLSPGDTARVVTTCSNTTSGDASLRLSIETEGALTLLDDKSQRLEVKANSENRATFRVVANREIGKGMIKVDAKGLGETFTEETELAIRPASPLQKRTASGAVEGGRKESLDLPVSDLIPSTASYTLTVSKNPIAQFANSLDYLVRYPYGCSEQLVSAAFPQIYFNDILQEMYTKEVYRKEVTRNVDRALSQLKSRQLYNGALTLWPGYGSENWWATAYAAHFYIEAQKAGYTIDEKFLNLMLDYLAQKLAQKETIDYYYNGNSNRKIAPKEVVYSLFVLTLADRTDGALLNYYRRNQQLLSLDSKYLLAATYALAGDEASAKTFLPNQFKGEEADNVSNAGFYSHARSEAIALYALLYVDPNNSQIGTMVQHVSNRLKESRYMNTQERIFSLLALGRFAKMQNAADVSATLRAGGKQLGTTQGETLTVTSEELAAGEVTLDVKGAGKLYYFFQAEGMSSTGQYTEEDSYLRVRRTFYDRFGRSISVNQVEQNDLIVVKLSINGSFSRTIENVVITDILPAGFEVENPRVDNLPGTSWIDDESYAEYLDIRDDRVHVFTDVSSSTRNFYYVVRAVSKGTFFMGPVAADAMYNGEYHSYHGAQWVTVE